jgi:plasmid stability protein
MPVNLSIKNVPDELAEKLRQRAERNHRSLQRELMAIIEQATQPGGLIARSAPQTASRAFLGVDEIFQRAQQRIPDGSPGSVEFIRKSRDEQIEKWGRGKP